MPKIFGAVLCVLCFAYVYFVQASVFSIVEREKLNKDVSNIQASVSELETEYIKIRSGINLEVAAKMGFTEDFNKINFANVDSGNRTGGLSFLSNEI